MEIIGQIHLKAWHTPNCTSIKTCIAMRRRRWALPPTAG
jgi:hypothetical protein